LYVFGHLSKWFTFFTFLVVRLLLSGRPLHLLPTVCSYKKLAISETKTVCHH
jgi:hypothetical protein